MEKSLYMCALCKGEFEFENIRYGNDGKKLICIDCYNKAIKDQAKDNNVKKIKITPKLDIIKLICMYCRYKFSFKKTSKSIIKCPYCGGDQFIRDEITAEKLIEEVSDSNIK